MFDDVTAMMLNIKVFWDVMPCRLLKYFPRILVSRLVGRAVRGFWVAWPWIWRNKTVRNVANK